MKVKKYLVINENGTCEIKTNQPNLKWNEVAILLDITIPNAIFQRPAITATLVIDDKQVRPEEITIGMKNQLKEVVLQNMGIEIKLIDPVKE